jgi:hypothetical protein
MFRSSQARSWVPNAVPVTSMNRSSARRITDRSASIPPRGLRSCVYTTVPTGRSIRFEQRRSRNASAPCPSTSIFEKDDWSNSATASRAARASTSIAGDQFSPAQPRGRRASSPRPAFDSYQLTRSQPPFSPKDAPSEICR